MNCWKSYGDNFLRTFLKYNDSKFKDQFKIINNRASKSVEFNSLYDFDGQYEIVKYFSLNNYIYLIFIDEYITFRWKKDKFSKFECNVDLSPLEVYCLLIDISNMKFERNTNYFHYSCKTINYNLNTIFKPYDKERNILHEYERDFISNAFWSNYLKSGYTECMAEFLESCSYLDEKSNFVYIYNNDNEDVIIVDINTGEFIAWYKMFHIGRCNRTNMITDIQIINFSDKLYDFLIKTFTSSFSAKDSISDNIETVENKGDQNIKKIQLNSIYGVCCSQTIYK